MRPIKAMAVILLPLVSCGCSRAGLPLNLINAPTIKGSGKVTTKSFDLSDFDEIAVGTAFQVEVTQAGQFSVEVTADDNLFSQIRVAKEGARLQIKLKANVTHATLKARVTLPALKAVEANAAAHVELKDIRSPQEVRIRASAASHVQGDVEAERLVLEASSASHVTLKGHARAGTLTGSSASHLDLTKFTTESAEVELSGASFADVSAKKKLDYNLRMASHLTYSGKPQLGRKLASGGSSAQGR